MRVGLVLGAGGPVGHAFHAGVLAAIHHALGWDPQRAARIIGTSAGAQVAALVRAGMQPADLAARTSGVGMSAAGAAIARCFVRPSYRRSEARPPWRPAAPEYLWQALKAPWRARPGRLVSALLPEGHVSLDEQARSLRRLFGDAWPERELWITAVDIANGERVVFGAPGAPSVDVGTAVACSGAVPGVCRPMRVGGTRYVDGGVASATHVDLAGDLDAVLVSSPLSMFGALRALLARDVARLTRRGVRVVTVEPRRECLRAMGANPMVLERAPAVARAAYRETLGEVRRGALGSLELTPCCDR
jgi:NTE family protein